MLRLHPVTYLYIAGAVILLTLALPLKGQLLVLAALTALAVLTPSTREHLGRVFRYLGLAVSFIFLLNGLIFPEATEIFTIAWLPFKKEGLYFAAEVSIRLLLLTLSQLLLFTGTSPHVVAAVLAERGISPQLIYIFLYSITLFKVLQHRIRRIFDAQVSRGLVVKGNILQRGRAMLPILVPLSLSYLSESAERAIFLELKGLNYKGRRTSLATIELPWGERVAGKAIFAFAGLLLLARIVEWATRRL